MKSSPQLKNSPAHPVAAMLAARGDKVEIQPNVSRERDSTAHPVAAMFAARAKEVKPPAQAIVPGVAAHPVAAMFAARAHEFAQVEFRYKTSNLEAPVNRSRYPNRLIQIVF